RSHGLRAILEELSLTLLNCEQQVKQLGNDWLTLSAGRRRMTGARCAPRSSRALASAAPLRNRGRFNTATPPNWRPAGRDTYASERCGALSVGPVLPEVITQLFRGPLEELDQLRPLRTRSRTAPGRSF